MIVDIMIMNLMTKIVSVDGQQNRMDVDNADDDS